MHIFKWDLNEEKKHYSDEVRVQTENFLVSRRLDKKFGVSNGA